MRKPFLTDMETEAKTNGYYSLPSQYNEAVNLARHGLWDWKTMRSTPYWIMKRVQFVWTLDALAKEKQQKDAERAAKG